MSSSQASETWQPVGYDDAVARLVVKPGEDPGAQEVHCFVNPAPSLVIGAAWALDQVLACLRRSADAGELGEAGPEARLLGHTIRALDRPGKIVWFEARDVS